MGFKKEDALADIDRAIAHEPPREVGWVAEMITHLHSCISRYAPRGSTHRSQADKFLAGHVEPAVVDHMKGVARSLRADIENGYLRNFDSIVSAEIFSDLLQQAEELITSHFRRAAAVLAGAPLEEHLRKLAVSASIPTTDASGKPFKASLLNAELKKANVYSKAEHAQVDAWQKIRNNAAHGEPNFETNHTDADITRMITGIRDFIVKHPS